MYLEKIYMILLKNPYQKISHRKDNFDQIKTFILYFPSTKDRHLEIKFYFWNQVDDKIVWGLGGGLPICSSFVC